MKNAIILNTGLYLLSLIVATAFLGSCNEEDRQENRAIRMQTPEAGAEIDLAGGGIRFRWQTAGVVKGGYNFILASDESEADRKVYPMPATVFSREIGAADLDLLLKSWGYAAGTAATIYWRVEAAEGGVDAEPLREITIRRLKAEAVEIPLAEPAENAVFDLRSAESVAFAWAAHADIASYALEFSATEDGEKLNLDTGDVDLRNIPTNGISVPAAVMQQIIEGSGRRESVVGLYWNVRSNSSEAPGVSESRRIRIVSKNAAELSPVSDAKAVPGNRRAQLSWTVDDPQTVRVEIEWTGGSKRVDVGQNDDKMSVIVDNLPEGEVVFTFTSYDAGNRASKSVTATADVYGDGFAANLTNRAVTIEKLFREGVTLAVARNDSEYLLYSELAYTDGEGRPASLRIANDRTEVSFETGQIFLPCTVSVKSCFAPEEQVLDPIVPEKVSEVRIPAYALMDKSKHDRYPGVKADHGDAGGQFAVSSMFDGITDNTLNMWHSSAGSTNASGTDGSLADDPILLTLDLGTTGKLSSLVVWGRYGGVPQNLKADESPTGSYWSFGSYNPRFFELWGTAQEPTEVGNMEKWKADGSWKDSGGWIKLADCRILRPSGETKTTYKQDGGAPGDEDALAAAYGIELPLPLDKPAVRYLRLVIRETWDFSKRKRISCGEMSFYSYTDSAE